MVKSESEIRKMTKQQLKQWLTKHDQRLPVDDRLKKYYVDRAISYFQLLQKEQSQINNNPKPSRSKSKIKHNGKIINNTRTKKKINSSISITPKSTRKKQPIVRTQRRHSSINNNNNNNDSSPTPSLTRSKKRIIRVRRKTPTKQSPSMTRSIKKKRERVRRATADPHSLQKEIEQNNDDTEPSSNDDDDVIDDIMTATESENGGDYKNKYQLERSNNLMKRKFVCEQDPEKMTISNLQSWLDKNSINFEIGQRKAAYVNLVRKYSLPSNYMYNGGGDDINHGEKKRYLSPQHKKHHSPKFKKSKGNEEKYSSPIAPLPRNLRKSPLTPQDDEKSNSRSKIQRNGNNDDNEKGGLLITPALNKTGVSRIDTPSKLAMRDEIRTLLELDDDPDPLRPLDDNDGITPGGPSNYDANELNNVLSDLRKECKHKPLSPKVKVFDPHKHRKSAMDGQDNKDNDDNIQRPTSTSFINAILAKFSPLKGTSTSIKQNEIKGVLKTGTNKKKHHKHSYIAQRTVPSPASPQPFGSPVDDHNNNNNDNGNYMKMNNGNYDNNKLISPINNYQQKLPLNQYPSKDNMNSNNNHGGFYEDEPMSPAITSIANNKPKYQQQEQQQQPVYAKKHRRSKRLENKRQSPPKQHIKHSQKQKIKTPPKKKTGFVMQQPSPGVAPSIPTSIAMQSNAMQSNARKNLSPMKLPFERKAANKVNIQNTNGRCKCFGKFIFVALIGVAVAVFFTIFDGMNKMNVILDELTEYINNYGTEERVLFCDVGKSVITGFNGDNIACIPCPEHASFCANGLVQCRSNYILQDNKCVLDGVVVKFAYEIHKQVNKILFERRGKYECGEIESIEGYTMKRDELISNCDILDNTKRDEAFEYFEKNILPESSVISKNQKGHYFSHKSIKSPICAMQEWAIRNILGLIATFIVIVVVFTIWCKYKRKQWQKKEIDAMIGNIYKVLGECDRFYNQEYVPVDIVKQRIKPTSSKLWKEVEDLIQNDVNIQKSMRMIDGMQRKCFKLLSVPAINNMNNLSQSWSPSQPQSQPQWNFTNNTNNQLHGHGDNKFNFLRSNQMQSKNFRNDDDKSEQTRFPPHSKRSMWQH